MVVFKKTVDRVWRVSQEKFRCCLVEVVFYVIWHIDVLEGQVVIEVGIFEVQGWYHEILICEVLRTRLEIRWAGEQAVRRACESLVRLRALKLGAALSIIRRFVPDGTTALMLGSFT